MSQLFVVTLIQGPQFFGKETNEGRLFNDFRIANSLEKIINEPTHAQDDGSQTCIDLICTDQPFIFINSGVLPSLDPLKA